MNKNNWTADWVASNYLDTDEYGILNLNNQIIIGLWMGLTRKQCEHIANEHNKAVKESKHET